jgi:hypothetical protein
MIIPEGGKLDDWAHIRSEIKKYMEENGVQLRADSGNATKCKGGVHRNSPSSDSCLIHYRGLYCACRTKIWKQPKERKRSRRSKRSASECKSCIRFKFNGVCWTVNKVVTTHVGHCSIMPKGIYKMSEADKTELRDLIISDRALHHPMTIVQVVVKKSKWRQWNLMPLMHQKTMSKLTKKIIMKIIILH